MGRSCTWRIRLCPVEHGTVVLGAALILDQVRDNRCAYRYLCDKTTWRYMYVAKLDQVFMLTQTTTKTWLTSQHGCQRATSASRQQTRSHPAPTHAHCRPRPFIVAATWDAGDRIRQSLRHHQLSRLIRLSPPWRAEAPHSPPHRPEPARPLAVCSAHNKTTTGPGTCPPEWRCLVFSPCRCALY